MSTTSNPHQSWSWRHLAPELPFEEARYPGSGKPLVGGAAPSEEFTVKGDEEVMRYYTADSPRYADVIAQVWFRSEADARRAGFTR